MNTKLFKQTSSKDHFNRVRPTLINIRAFLGKEDGAMTAEWELTYRERWQGHRKFCCEAICLQSTPIPSYT